MQRATLSLSLSLLVIVSASSASALILTVGTGADCTLDDGVLGGPGCSAVGFSLDYEDGTYAFESNTPQALGEDSLLSIRVVATEDGSQSISFTFQDNGAASRFNLVASTPLDPWRSGALSFLAQLKIDCGGAPCPLGPQARVLAAAGSSSGGVLVAPIGPPGLAFISATDANTVGGASIIATTPELCTLPGGSIEPCTTISLETIIAVDGTGGGTMTTVSSSLDIVPEPSSTLLTAIGLLGLAASRSRRRTVPSES